LHLTSPFNQPESGVEKLMAEADESIKKKNILLTLNVK